MVCRSFLDLNGSAYERSCSTEFEKASDKAILVWHADVIWNHVLKLKEFYQKK